MKKFLIMILAGVTLAFAAYPDGMELLRKADKNMTSENQMVLSKMIIDSKRGSRTIETKSYTKGEESSFTEYLAPAREAGIKMLKLGDKLWTYDPDADRTITISGHMLRQSISGSDLSYEDMMEENSLEESYSATTLGEDTVDGRACWVVELIALNDGVSYYKQKLSLDKERFLSLRSELYAKSGKLLKVMEIRQVMNVDGRWYPKEMYYRDVLNKHSKGTRFIVDDIKFDVDMPDYIFTKAALKK